MYRNLTVFTRALQYKKKYLTKACLAISLLRSKAKSHAHGMGRIV